MTRSTGSVWPRSKRRRRRKKRGSRRRMEVAELVSLSGRVDGWAEPALAAVWLGSLFFI